MYGRVGGGFGAYYFDAHSLTMYRTCPPQRKNTYAKVEGGGEGGKAVSFLLTCYLKSTGSMLQYLVVLLASHLVNRIYPVSFCVAPITYHCSLF